MMKRSRLSKLQDLEKTAEALIPDCEQVLLEGLQKRLPKFSVEFGNACLGVMPRVIVNALDAAYYLCRTTAAARAAQRHTGVPASLLLAEGLTDGFDPDFPAVKLRNDYFATGNHFPGVAASFLFHALNLADDKRLDRVINGRAEGVKPYLSYITLCERWDRIYCLDLVERIESNGLTDMDIRA